MLLAGPPGTGKTLMAKAVAGEAGVPFFSAAGTEFAEIYSGVGASRVRDMFEVARKSAPCILFIDEFDSIGKKREGGAMGGNDENVATINQLLTEMDGFENNEGILVMAATNRPSALDEALTRPGRFDRIITMGLPNSEGREAIFHVHARGKRVAEDVNWGLVARATAGFSGAEIMNVMNVSATMAVQAREGTITQDRIFEAIEKLQVEKTNRGTVVRTDLIDEDVVPPLVRRQVAVYLAAKALIGAITPYYDEVSKITCCPGGTPTGQVFFVPQEEALDQAVLTRGYLESRVVTSMAGRCAERLVFGPEYVSTMGTADVYQANVTARDMVYKYGFGRRVGPLSLVDETTDFLKAGNTDLITDVTPDIAKIAAADIGDILAAAEAKVRPSA